MKLLNLITVFTTVTAIRVPPSWDTDEQLSSNKYRTIQGSETATAATRPYVQIIDQQKITRQKNLAPFKPSPVGWIPIMPPPVHNPQQNYKTITHPSIRQGKKYRNNGKRQPEMRIVKKPEGMRLVPVITRYTTQSDDDDDDDDVSRETIPIIITQPKIPKRKIKSRKNRKKPKLDEDARQMETIIEEPFEIPTKNVYPRGQLTNQRNKNKLKSDENAKQVEPTIEEIIGEPFGIPTKQVYPGGLLVNQKNRKRPKYEFEDTRQSIKESHNEELIEPTEAFYGGQLTNQKDRTKLKYEFEDTREPTKEIYNVPSHYEETIKSSYPEGQWVNQKIRKKTNSLKPDIEDTGQLSIEEIYNPPKSHYKELLKIPTNSEGIKRKNRKKPKKPKSEDTTQEPHIEETYEAFKNRYEEPLETPFEQVYPKGQLFNRKKHRKPKSESEDAEEASIEETYEVPKSHHEEPLDIPTKPIYPGEGQWAQRGKKHKPFISKHKFDELPENDKEPDGYDTFLTGQSYFDTQNENFGRDFEELINPKPQKLIRKQKQKKPEKIKETDEDFVPTKLYAQVRRSDSVDHLPVNKEEPRLREVVKDSVIHTVYTEEGYEDSAYDHAGHEKNAENNQGFSKFDKGVAKKKENNTPKTADSDSSGSHIQPKILAKKMETKEMKTTSVKDKNDKTEMEISTEIKTIHSPNDTTTQKFVKIYPKIHQKRQKRSSKDPLDINIDFINKINHTIPSVKPKLTKSKYPYYTSSNLNPNSPLRYAEDMDNIPKKSENVLAFYQQADKIVCPEVPKDVNPIPDRIKNKTEDDEDNEEVKEMPELPRLKNLGDKIDCYKVKYFGIDPLDSPIFKEETVGSVASIFDLNKDNSPNDRIVNEVISEAEKEHLELLDQIEDDTNNEETVTEPDKYHNHKTEEAEETTENSEETESSLTEEKDNSEMNILSDIISQIGNKTEKPREIFNLNEVPMKKSDNPPIFTILTTPKYTIDLQPKHIYDQIELLKYLPKVEEPTKENGFEDKKFDEAPKQRQSKNMEESKEEVTEKSPPVSEALILLRRKNRRKIRIKRPQFQIFDVNKFLPKRSFLDHTVSPSTVLPKYKTVSEVHYKDDINPNQQLTVLHDIMNIIRNTPEDSSVSTSKILGNIAYGNIDINGEMYDLDNVESNNNYLLSSTTRKPFRGSQKFHLNQNEDYEEILKKSNFDSRRIRKTTTTELPKNHEKNYDYDDKTEVFGLLPPGQDSYSSLNEMSGQTTNNFYVIGMKPPPQFYFTEYKTLAKRPKRNRRVKRELNRQNYSVVSRNRNKPIDIEDTTEVKVADDDDYIPKRNRNYHYDEKLGRIVYDNVGKEEEEKYVEVTDKPIPKPTLRRITTLKPTDNVNEPSYVDFVMKLKSNPDYKVILDPTTTEATKTTETSTVVVESTTPPAFLDFLTKIKSDPNYKIIDDKKNKTATKEDKESQIEEDKKESRIEEEKEEKTDSQDKAVKNSPGERNFAQNFQIFDISGYLPKIKTFTPKTSIDYSKYKTIERPTLRHTLSSRYTDDTLNVSTVPSLLKEEIITKIEEIETTTQPISTTTTKRVRIRTKLRRPSTLPVISTPSSFVASPTNQKSEVSSSLPHDKPTRVFPRRRPVRIKINKTEPNVYSETENSTKVIRRRHQNLNQTANLPETDTKLVVIVDEHREDEPQEEEVTNTMPKPFKIDLNVEKNVNVFKKYDKNQKNGGNYHEENEENNSSLNEKLGDVEIFKKFDKKKKHGGNFKQEEEIKEMTEKTNQNFDKVENIDTLKNKKYEAIQQVKNIAPTEINKNFNENIKNEKNLEKLEQVAQDRIDTIEEPKEVHIIKQFDILRKHGGNYKTEPIEEEEEETKLIRKFNENLTDEKYKKKDINKKEEEQTESSSQEDDYDEEEEDNEEKSKLQKRLISVVPKTLRFYTDPRLPKKINQLKENDADMDEYEHEEEEEESEEIDDKIKNNEETTTPLIIKDPSKRLYFYVSV